MLCMFGLPVMKVLIEIVQNFSFGHTAYKFVRESLSLTGSDIFKIKLRQCCWVGKVLLLF